MILVCIWNRVWITIIVIRINVHEWRRISTSHMNAFIFMSFLQFIIILCFNIINANVSWAYNFNFWIFWWRHRISICWSFTSWRSRWGFIKIINYIFSWSMSVHRICGSIPSQKLLDFTDIVANCYSILCIDIFVQFTQILFNVLWIYELILSFIKHFWLV